MAVADPKSKLYIVYEARVHSGPKSRVVYTVFVGAYAHLDFVSLTHRFILKFGSNKKS